MVTEGKAEKEQPVQNPAVTDEATLSNSQRTVMKRQKKSVVQDLDCIHREQTLRTGRRCALSPLDPFGTSNFIGLAEDIEPHISSPMSALESMLDGSEDGDAGEAQNREEYICGGELPPSPPGYVCNFSVTTTEEMQAEDEPLQFQFDSDVVQIGDPELFFVKPIEYRGGGGGRWHEKIRH